MMRILVRTARLMAACGLLAAAFGGCAAARPPRIALPAKHTVRSDQLLVVSDFKIGKDHPLIRDLMLLREQVAETLDLPLGKGEVMVYVFSNELEYTQYLQSTFPGYPARRAYFIQSPGKELAVYTWWGERIQEDLRHEFTHGLLHASLEAVPLWLDEGLAEYFEVAGPVPGKINVEHLQTLSQSVQNGWRPDLDRLEALEKVEQMQRADYREAWAWVHFMLHGSPDTREVLLSYLHELRTNPHPGSLHPRLSSEVRNLDNRLVGYVSALGSYGGWLTAMPDGGVQPVRAGNF
jgi:hypothetical protein